MKVPISAARKVAEEFGQEQVIMFTWDGKTLTAVTYGKTIDDCEKAARGANIIKRGWDWPEKLCGEPSRVEALKRRITELEDALRNPMRAEAGERYLHAKGATYFKLGELTDETNARQGTKMVLYRNKQNMFFVREAEEFEERFTPITT